MNALSPSNIKIKKEKYIYKQIIQVGKSTPNSIRSVERSSCLVGYALDSSFVGTDSRAYHAAAAVHDAGNVQNPKQHDQGEVIF